METRNVQKTGKMHYLYLPTEWCKKHGINSDTQLVVSEDEEGSLSISPKLVEKKSKDLVISTGEEDLQVLQKLLMACYINPTNSFKINLQKSMDLSKILQQKKLISLFMIEAHGNTITGETNVTIENPLSLLQTMVKKSRNLIYLMTDDSWDEELIARYEEEIDKSNIFVEKAVINSFTYHRSSKLKTIETYYVSLLTRDVERLIDHVICLRKNDIPFLKGVLGVIDTIKTMLNSVNNGNTRDSFNYKQCIKLVKDIISLGKIDVRDIHSYHVNRVKAQLFSISEVLMDWAVSLELEEV